MRGGPALTTGSVPRISIRYASSLKGSTTWPKTSTAVLKSNAIVSGRCEDRDGAHDPTVTAVVANIVASDAYLATSRSAEGESRHR